MQTKHILFNIKAIIGKKTQKSFPKINTKIATKRKCLLTITSLFAIVFTDLAFSKEQSNIIIIPFLKNSRMHINDKKCSMLNQLQKYIDFRHNNINK